MSLETGNWISNLVSSNPTGADPKSRGDDHLRLLKSVLQNCFAGLTGAIMVGGVNGGAANAYTLTPTPPLPALVDNMQIVFSPTVPNTGACTMNVSGLGIIDLLSVSGQPLVANDLVIGQRYRATYDGVAFRLNAITKNYADQLAFSTALPAQSLGFLRSTGTVASFGVTHTGYAQNEVRGADIASAANINLTTATGNFLHVTGTTGITGMTIPAGAERTLVFDAILTLTNSANLILPGGANITTAAGDTAVVRGESGGVARVVSYDRANGQAVIFTPPALVLLASLTPTAAANLDALNVFTSAYDAYRIEIEGVTPNATDQLQMRFANGGTVDTSGNYGVVAINLADEQSITSTVTQMNLTTANSTSSLSLTVEIKNANSTAKGKSASILGSKPDTATSNAVGVAKIGTYKGTSALSGFRLFWAGGNNFQASGKVLVYGYLTQ